MSLYIGYIRMKNRKIYLSSLFLLCSSASWAYQIHVKNNITPFGQYNKNIIFVADKGNFKAGDDNWGSQVKSAAADMSYIGNDLFAAQPLYQWSGSDKYPWGYVGYKVYLADDNGKPADYLGYFGFTIDGNPADKNGIINKYSVQFSDKGHDPRYTFSQQPSLKYINQANFEINGQLTGDSPVSGMPIITNAGWTSGMGNQDSVFATNESFWVTDYGNEDGRWTVDFNNGAIQQTTKKINGNQSSRAYPVMQDSSGKYLPGIGDAKEGVWQIDMQVGSHESSKDTGAKFCETFYLAERKNLAPGPNNYLDGSGSAQGGNGREIDIMESLWQDGPQTNLPNGDGTSSWNAAYSNKVLGKWSDIGGLPAHEFITFGAYIKGSNLWLYAYKADGTQWYSSDAIPLKSDYQQEGVFVPYIGTWEYNQLGSSDEVLDTKYKNFVYKTVDQMGNLNPHDNPQEFFAATHK
jgi:hypothetical protein